MTINVFPCPFCAHDDVEIDEIEPKVYAVCCPNCMAVGPMSVHSPEHAITLWNGAGFEAEPAETPYWMNQTVRNDE